MKLDNFIEYYSPTVYYVPNFPTSFPALSFYLLSIISEHGNHSNVVLIDPEHQTIDRFDPEGGFGQEVDQMDDWLKNLFSSHKQLKHFKYLGAAGSNTYQLIEAVQNDERPGDPIGFCTAWCIWYIETRAKNRDWHPALIWENASQKIFQNANIRSHIRGYAIALSERRNRLIVQILGEYARNKEIFSDKEALLIQENVDWRIQNIINKNTER